ncbi:MAG: hypothetical protein IPQ07_36145 [Myxococcales bacterium]|nr:hypothetical protein [Myxococcales bacterium]
MLPAFRCVAFADRCDPRGSSVILGSSVVFHFAIAIAATFWDIEVPERHGRARVQPDVQARDLSGPTWSSPEVTKSPDQGSAASNATPEKKKKPATVPSKPSEKPDGGRSDKDTVAMQEEERGFPICSPAKARRHQRGDMANAARARISVSRSMASREAASGRHRWRRWSWLAR